MHYTNVGWFLSNRHSHSVHACQLSFTLHALFEKSKESDEKGLSSYRWRQIHNVGHIVPFKCNGPFTEFVQFHVQKCNSCSCSVQFRFLILYLFYSILFLDSIRRRQRLWHVWVRTPVNLFPWHCEQPHPQHFRSWRRGYKWSQISRQRAGSDRAGELWILEWFTLRQPVILREPRLIKHSYTALTVQLPDT